ncbi:MAG: PilZ domain-containing protein [Pyrinomonadaceae bacterium]|nr:PilZ domain-containing protein [Pyrinomonadaceae bacterium]
MLPKQPDEALSPKERRKSDRKKLIVDVRFDGGDATGIANTRDIGIGGLYITTNANLSTGDQIAMEMMIAGEQASVGGVVAYVDPGQGVGVRFRDLTPENEKLLKKELEME